MPILQRNRPTCGKGAFDQQFDTASDAAANNSHPGSVQVPASGHLPGSRRIPAVEHRGEAATCQSCPSQCPISIRRPNPNPAQTDASRAQLAELQIQARVAEELRRLQVAEATALREVQEKLSEPSDQDRADGPSRYTLSREAAALRVRLEDEKKKVRNLPDTLENARSEVVRCLRENDRRPLDCWKEVATFKEEVRKLEKGWVEKVVS